MREFPGEVSFENEMACESDSLNTYKSNVNSQRRVFFPQISLSNPPQLRMSRSVRSNKYNKKSEFE